MIRPALKLLCSGLLICCFSGCESSGSGEDGSTKPVDPKRAIMSNIVGLGNDLYNTNWVGQPCGVVNKTTTCPGGGAVVITGSFSCPVASNGVQNMTLDFAYDMTGCVEVRNGLNVALTGKMTHTGSSTNVNSTVTAETIAYKSNAAVAIVATGEAYESFDGPCDFSLTSRIYDDGTSGVTGTLCGESFSLSHDAD